jgi:hypothetical protein
MITVELFAKPKPNDRHYYAYDLVHAGEVIVSNSRDPEHDLSRALLARGNKGVVEVINGWTGKPRSRVIIERAAKWCVGSNLERYKWKRAQISNGSPHVDENKLRGAEMPAGSLGPPCAVVGFPQKNVAARVAGSEAS